MELASEAVDVSDRLALFSLLCEQQDLTTIVNIVHNCW